MSESDLFGKIAKDLEGFCFELQFQFPEYTKSLIPEDVLNKKTDKEIEEMLRSDEILNNSMPYILQQNSWAPGRIACHASKDLPQDLSKAIMDRFKSHIPN